MKGAKTYWGPTQSYKFQNIQRRVWWKEAKEAKEPRGPPNAYYSLCVLCVSMQKNTSKNVLEQKKPPPLPATLRKGFEARFKLF